jgi:hypothetical protein
VHTIHLIFPFQPSRSVGAEHLVGSVWRMHARGVREDLVNGDPPLVI